MRARTLVLVLFVGLAASGCGGGNGEPEATTETEQLDSEAHREFVAEGDALCAEAQAEAAGLARRAQEIQSQRGAISDAEVLDQAADLWDDQIELAERFRDQLADLDAPPADEPRVTAFVDALDDGIEIAHDIQDTLAGGEDVAPQLVESYGATVIRGNTLAQAFGFTVCGRSS